MKVGQSGDTPKVTTPPTQAGAAAAPAKKEATAKQAAAQAANSANSSGVAVMVSNSVRSLEQANRAETAADVDMDKVNAVRASIEDGTYTVNAEAIADKLLANAQEMLDRTQN